LVQEKPQAALLVGDVDGDKVQAQISSIGIQAEARSIVAKGRGLVDRHYQIVSPGPSHLLTVLIGHSMTSGALSTAVKLPNRECAATFKENPDHSFLARGNVPATAR